ncbi:MAG: methylenetetrahydrofolate reductase [Candidatus Vidania fulgoroideorum]
MNYKYKIKFSFEIFPYNLKTRNLIFFLKKMKKFGRGIISITFSKRKNFTYTIKKSILTKKLNSITIIHFKNQNNIRKNLKLIKIIKNNKIKNLLILKGKKAIIDKIIFSDKYIIKINKKICCSYYPEFHENSINIKKEKIFNKYKTKNKNIIITQYCIDIYTIINTIRKIYKKNKLIIGLFVFKNYKQSKKITKICNIKTNKWKNYLTTNKKRKIEIYIENIFKTIIILIKYKIKKIHLYTLNNLKTSLKLIKAISK